MPRHEKQATLAYGVSTSGEAAQSALLPGAARQRYKADHNAKIGRKLVHRLATDSALSARAITAFTLLDTVPSEPPHGFAGSVKSVTADLATPGVAETVMAGRPDIIFHLAGVVSGEAEADFEKGYRVNLDGTRWRSGRTVSPIARGSCSPLRSLPMGRHFQM